MSARRLLRPVPLLGCLIVLLGIALCLSVAVGAVDFPPGRILRIVSRAATGWPDRSWQPWEESVVLRLRLPRAVVGVLVGGGLALSGAVCQGIFRNPLADPGMIGITSGASLGAVAALYLGWAARWSIALPASAFAGALATTFLVWAVATRQGRGSVTSLVLAGVAVGSVAVALSSLILSWSLSYSDTGRQIVFWLMGGLEARTWFHVKIAAPFVLGGSLWMLLYARSLNVLATGEESALSLGIDVPVARRNMMVLASMVTGSAVAVAGSIAFVGLVVPHIVRRIAGPDHRLLLPASFLAGAVLLVSADIAARTLASPEELRLGILTTLLGGPFFMFLLLAGKKEFQAP